MKSVITLCCFIIFAMGASAQNPYWKKINSGTHKKLMSVSFGSSLVGYISGADSLLLKTTDGGKNWSPVNYSGLSFSLAGEDIVHINFINDTVGWAVVSNYTNPQYMGTLYKTTNGGLNWNSITSGNIAVYTAFFFDEHNGYEAGSAFFSGQTIMKLSNGSWGNYHSFNSDPTTFLYCIDFRNSNIGITGGNGGYVYRTFNAGLTWDTVKTNTDSTVYALKYLNDSTILGATNNPSGAIIISTDSGRSWQPDMNTLTFFYPEMKGMTLSKKDSFFAVGKVSWDSTGMILSWHNGFAALYPAEQPLNAVAMANDSVGFVVGDSGLIMSNHESLVNINAPASSFSFVKLYPNPSSGKVFTTMDIAHEVEVFDLSGKLLVKQDFPAIQHVIHLESYSKGIYLIKIKAKGQVAVFRKILIE